MCGIVGYVGGRPCRELLVAGLEKLEYRGYDSAGVSVIADGQIDSVRAVGNLANLRAAVEARRRTAAASPSPRRRRRPASPTPAGPPTAASPRRTPTRTATAPTAIHIVLNGIVENHAELRARARGRGPRVQLRDRRRGRRPPDRAPLRRRPRPPRSAPPSPSCAATTPSSPCTPTSPSVLVGARKECPLVAGVGEGETFLASAIPAFLAETRNVMLIENGEIVTIDACRRARSPTPRATRSSARPRRSPGTRTPPRRAATRPSC